MTIADNLQTLIDCKADMKSAIEEKGVTVSGGLSTYADAIRQIEGGDEIIIKCEQGLNYNCVGSTNTLVLDLIDINDATKLCATLIDRALNSNYYSAKEIRIINFNKNIHSTRQMFMKNVSLEKVNLFDTSNVNYMNDMFYDCDKLTTIPPFDTSNVTNMSGMFQYCSSINNLPELDCSNVTNVNYLVSGCYKLTDLEGFKNLGMQPSINGLDDCFDECLNLTHTSLMNIINKLYDRKSAGYSVLDIKLHPNHFDLLTDEDIAIAINKGWTLS